MDKNSIKNLCDNDPYLKEKLYFRGFLITDNEIDDTDYPFYGGWNKKKIDKYYIYNHSQLPCFTESSGDTSIGLLGHAYDPFASEIDESVIVHKLLENLGDRDKFFDIVNELTGVFCMFVIKGGKLTLINDTVGLEALFYTESVSPFYASSHINLIGDLAGFTEDPYITRLKACRTFYYFGNQLPGNYSKFSEAKRLTPNHYVTVGEKVELKRFYHPHYLDISDEEAVSRLCDALQKTMKTISEKWERPAISLTGGCDSRTTLAAACGIYDKFKFFSYDSQPNETPDAEAAALICKKLGLHHTIYNVPYEDSAFDNIDGIRSIMIWNGGDIRDNNPNDVRKRAFLDKINDYDVDIKSWASEITRARYSKRYAGKRSFGIKPSPRQCTTFYKFLTSRRLVNETDKVFKEFIDKCYEPDKDHPIPWQDQFYWEWHWPSRDGVTMVSEHMFSDIITVPYNNRKILEILLSTSFENKYNDVLFAMARERMDARIDKAAESVVDVNHTKARAYKELLYYKVNTMLPY